jgi:hypothetical protein
MLKSELVPKQVFKFLGWNWDSVEMQVSLGIEKQQSLSKMVMDWTLKMK